MNKNEEMCPICKEFKANKIPITGDIGSYCYECERCGRFVIPINLPFDSIYDVRHLVSAWVQTQNKAGIKFPIIGENSKDLGKWLLSLEYMGFPRKVIEKCDSLLRAYANNLSMRNRDCNESIKINSYPELISEIAAYDYRELQALNTLLEELGYITIKTVGINTYVTLKAKGWIHVDELGTKDNSTNNSAFIAMWYDSCTSRYRDSVITTVEYCGYKPVIIDQQEFNDFIMNQLVALIRQSRFVIADFTCREEIKDRNRIKQGVRGGVYWEAGMAYGLGIPVIHTCEDNDESKQRIHFDVDQYNTIFWKFDELGKDIRDLSTTIEDPHFKERLAQRILATVGRGNYNKQTND